MHVIMFTRVTLEAIGILEHLDLPLRFLRLCAVHIPLLFQLADLAMTTDEMKHRLVSYKKKDDQKGKQGNRILTPLLYFNRCPKLRKSHNFPQIRCKVTKKLAYMQIFMYFCSRINSIHHMKTRIGLFVATLLVCQFLLAQTHIHVDDPLTWRSETLQPYIGQTVVFDVPMVVCSNDGAYTISTRRLFSPTNQVLPKSQDMATYNRFVSLNAAGRVNLSNVSGYHRCGEKIYNLTASVLGENGAVQGLKFLSGEWRGNTRADLENMNVHREIGVEDCDSCLVVCAYNLEWYDITKTTKQKKINSALTLIDADILGLIEIEGQEATRKRVAELLNSTLKHRNYNYIKETKGSEESQTVVFVYDSKRIKPLGSVQYIDRRVSNRKKMMCFELISTGERFIYSVNHFKAKTGGGTGGNADIGDGQGGWNADRKEEAQAVIDEYKRWSRQIGENDILLMGDLNALGKEDPITLLKDNGMTDLHRRFHADSSYSYMHQQLAGYLDHALCNNSMYPQVTGMMVLHCNSDEVRNKSASEENMFTASDHDPVVVGLKLDGTIVYDPSPKINTADIFYGEANEITIRDAYSETQKSFYAIYNTSGIMLERNEILSELQEVVFPTTPGMYIVYVYYNGQTYKHRVLIR